MIWTIFPVFISERGQLPIAMAALQTLQVIIGFQLQCQRIHQQRALLVFMAATVVGGAQHHLASAIQTSALGAEQLADGRDAERGGCQPRRRAVCSPPSHHH